jgi:hypothetical protein
MRLLLALVAILLAVSACTLGTAQEVRENSLNATQTAQPLATTFAKETSVPLPIATVATTIEFPPTPVLQTNDSVVCGRLRVDVGADPGNTLRLREQPNNTSTIILLIPNSSIVTRVAGSQDVAAGGFTWVNIQYTDPNGVVATGWAAKDAMADRATLRQEGC